MERLKAFDFAKYESLDLDRLVIYTIVQLERLGTGLSLENIIVGAFKLFPKKFSLVGYPEFPDATRVEKSLWRSKQSKKQWIGGKTPHGYQITERTRIIADQTETQLSDIALVRKRKTPARLRRKESILKDTTDSDGYSKYVSGKKESISAADFCYLLQGTLDSTPETLRRNLLSLKQFAEELERFDVLEFLNWLENRFRNHLIK